MVILDFFVTFEPKAMILYWYHWKDNKIPMQLVEQKFRDVYLLSRKLVQKTQFALKIPQLYKENIQISLKKQY